MQQDARTGSGFGFGPASFVLGAVAFGLVLLSVFAGPFEPVPKAEVGIVEIASELRDAAKRELLGQPQPAPERAAMTIDRLLKIAAIGAGGLAIVCGLYAFVRQEPMRAAGVGIGLGAGAITLQLFAMIAFALLGILLIWVILQNLGEILPWS